MDSAGPLARKILNQARLLSGFLMLDVYTLRSYSSHIGTWSEWQNMRAERVKIGRYCFAFIYLSRIDRILLSLPFRKRRENLCKPTAFRVSGLLWAACRHKGADLILFPRRCLTKTFKEKY